MSIKRTKPLRIKNPRRTTEADKEIISQMWKANQAARKIASFTGLPFDELRDAAMEYIVKLHKSWDSGKGANFSTWVNRNLQFHMLNYLRDHSRLVKIPRSYSDLYLKIRKFTLKNPDITDEAIAKELDVPVRKISQVRKAFLMSFSEINDYSEAVEDKVEEEVNLDTLYSSNRDLLYRISDLDEAEEELLMDVLVRRRTSATVLRKNPNIKKQEDINPHVEEILDRLLWQ
jgi:DNA-directed RNA polymerase specialized sigma subunit